MPECDWQWQPGRYFSYFVANWKCSKVIFKVALKKKPLGNPSWKTRIIQYPIILMHININSFIHSFLVTSLSRLWIRSICREHWVWCWDTPWKGHQSIWWHHAPKQSNNLTTSICLEGVRKPETPEENHVYTGSCDAAFILFVINKCRQMYWFIGTNWLILCYSELILKNILDFKLIFPQRRQCT